MESTFRARAVLRDCAVEDASGDNIPAIYLEGGELDAEQTVFHRCKSPIFARGGVVRATGCRFSDMSDALSSAKDAAL
ncbi:MAG: hypothetical protein FWF31_05230 [Desulfobulbus sp.]|nr:hypothetical protein [Desulfobulbus sp.]